mmetsp:Transcript_20781/g.34598  ORF Transcript_20781/g.34598 Transcript_20781/m.34598 type:complete len:180 (-) Transcript_20781:87-626(-)
MAPRQPLHPAEDVIKQTFAVFSGSHATMDEAHFAKFCQSSARMHERRSVEEASYIFRSVVQDAKQGMNLHDFKAALAILVEENAQRFAKPRQPARKVSRTFRWDPDLFEDSGAEDDDSKLCTQSAPLSSPPKRPAPLRTPPRRVLRSTHRMTPTLRWQPSLLDEEWQPEPSPAEAGAGA